MAAEEAITIATATLVLVECPICGRERELTARQARRKLGPCAECRPRKTRAIMHQIFWLERFTDVEICEMAEALCNVRPGSSDPALVALTRARLLW